MDSARLVSTIAGLIIIFTTFYWAARILMVKGTDPPTVARFIFRICRNALHFTGELMPNAAKRRELFALYIPASLLCILAVSVILSTLGFMLLLYGVTQNSMSVAYENSISSMSTLGIAGEPKTLLEATIGSIEALTGPVFIALLVAYTVTIYTAYGTFRTSVEVMDETLHGFTTGGELLWAQIQRNGPDGLSTVWQPWIDQFAAVKRTYSSVDGYLLLFAPNMSKHWSVSAPMLLDAAALRYSLIAGAPDPGATQVLDSGTQVFDLLTQHYGHRVIRFRKTRPRPEIDRPLFDYYAAAMSAEGIPVATDIDQAWNDFRATADRYASQVQRLARMLPDSD